MVQGCKLGSLDDSNLPNCTIFAENIINLYTFKSLVLPIWLDHKLGHALEVPKNIEFVNAIIGE